MPDYTNLEGKTILIVDDEPDIVETIADELEDCILKKATNFEAASQFLENDPIDCAILDIMGVDGYKLLEIATERKVPAVMLTAHALSPDNFVKSIQSGASAYVPKDKLIDIAFYVWDAIREKEEKETKPGKWFSKLKAYYERKFGPGWLDEYKNVWQ